ncbi:hypothetical protein Dimus_031353 [Dionaea muscipula]
MTSIKLVCLDYNRPSRPRFGSSIDSSYSNNPSRFHLFSFSRNSTMASCKFSHSRFEFNISQQVPHQSSSPPSAPTSSSSSSAVRIQIKFQHRREKEYIVRNKEGTQELFDHNEELISKKMINVDRRLAASGALYSTVNHALEAVGAKAEMYRPVADGVVEEAKKLLLLCSEGKQRRRRSCTMEEEEKKKKNHNKVLFVEMFSIDCYVCYEDVASNFDGAGDRRKPQVICRMIDL